MPGAIKKLKPATIHEIFPEEIFVMILKKLDYKSLAMARDACTRWRNVIDGFGLLSLKNFGKFFPLPSYQFYTIFVFNFS